MKKVFNNIMRGVVALSIFAIAGCADTSIDSQPEAAANIQTDARESYDFTAISPMTVSFSVSANTPWRVESDAQWCTVTPSMSATSSLVETITISVEENTEYSPREATLTILGTDIDFVKTIAVKQDSNADLIVLTPSAPVAAGGENIEITVHSNKAWEYFALSDILQDADVKSGDGSGDATITVKVPANPGLSREGQFMIRTALEERTYTIMQDGMVLRTSVGAIALDWNEFEYTVPVDANIDWVAEITEGAESWLSVEKTNATTLVVKTLGYNKDFAVHEAEISIKPAVAVPGIDDVVIPVTHDMCYILDNAEIVENGVKLSFDLATTMLKTKFSFSQGKITIKFAEVSMSGARMMFDFWTTFAGGNSNWRTFLNSVKSYNGAAATMTKSQTGGGFSWVQHNFSTAAGEKHFDEDTINSLTLAEFELKLHADDRGTDYSLLFETSETTKLTVNPSRTLDDDANYNFTFGIAANQVNAGDYVVIESIDFEIYE